MKRNHQQTTAITWKPEDEIAAWEEEYATGLSRLEDVLRGLFLPFVRHPVYDRSFFLEYLGKVVERTERDSRRQDLTELFKTFEHIFKHKAAETEMFHCWFGADLLLVAHTAVHPLTRPAELTRTLDRLIPKDRKKTHVFFDFLACNGPEDRFYRADFIRIESQYFLDLAGFTRLAPKEFPEEMRDFLDNFYRENPAFFEFFVLDSREIEKITGRSKKPHAFIIR